MWRRAFEGGGLSLRVLLVTGVFPPDIGGPATYVPQVAGGLVERGHLVTVVTLSDANVSDQQRYAFEVVRLPRGMRKPLRWLRTVAKLVRLGRTADVLFVNGLALEAALANLVLRKPLVHRVVGDLAWERSRNRGWTNDLFEDFQTKRYGLKVESLKALRAWWTRQAGRIIVPCAYLAPWIARWGVPRDRIAVIGNATELLNGIRPADIPLRTPVNIASVGRLLTLKRVDMLLEVMARLARVGLVIVGDGPERPRLEELVTRLEISDRVYFAGQKSRAEALALMAACDLVVSNSVHEGFPHVLLEAMSLGVPVVATAVGGTSEIVEDGRNGLLIQPTEDALVRALQRMADDRPLRSHLAAEGRKDALSRFTVPGLIDRTEALLMEAAATHRARRGRLAGDVQRR